MLPHVATKRTKPPAPAMRPPEPGWMPRRPLSQPEASFRAQTAIATTHKLSWSAWARELLECAAPAEGDERPHAERLARLLSLIAPEPVTRKRQPRKRREKHENADEKNNFSDARRGLDYPK